MTKKEVVIGVLTGLKGGTQFNGMGIAKMLEKSGMKIDVSYVYRIIRLLCKKGAIIYEGYDGTTKIFRKKKGKWYKEIANYLRERTKEHVNL